MFWLVAAGLGLVYALIPGSVPLQGLLSGAIAGAGVAGLLAELTISFDRRDSDFELQVQRQRYAALDGQVHRVDELSKSTSIVATTQLFKLGIDLYQVRFVADPEAGVFRDEAKYLGEALRLTDAVEVFLASPYLHAADGLPPEGRDPFPPLKAAVQLLYPQEGVAALMAGSTASTIMHTAGGLTDSSYRETAVGILRGAIGQLYLPPNVCENVLSAIGELKAGTCEPGHFAGYLTLFSFYLGYRMTGAYGNVAPVFESPVSLSDPATVEAVRRALGELSGRPQAATAPSQVAPPSSAAGPTTTAAVGAPDRQPWFQFVRTRFVLFWLAVSLAGVVVAVIPFALSGKDLLTSAIVGAGLAGAMSEVTFSSDRRTDQAGIEEQHRRMRRLTRHLGQVDKLLTRSRMADINLLSELGRDLYRVRFGSEADLEGFKAAAEDLARFLGLTTPIEKFLRSPYLRPVDVPPEGRDPFPAFYESVGLRYAQEGLLALKLGSALGLILESGLADGAQRETVAGLLESAAGRLYLEPVGDDNLRRAAELLRSGACDPAAFIQYLVLFDLYLDHRMSGRHAEVAPLFEGPVSLTDTSTITEVRRILAQVAGEAEAHPPGGTEPPTTGAAEPPTRGAPEAVPSDATAG